MWRKFFRWKDDWTVDIVNTSLLAEKQIDPRMFMLIMAFQTDRDYWASYRYATNNGPQANFANREKASPELLAARKNLEQYQMTLEKYREQLSGIEPSEEEITSVEDIVEMHLNLSELEIEPNKEVELPEAARIIAMEKATAAVLPLLNSDELSPGQKSALFLLLDQVLN